MKEFITKIMQENYEVDKLYNRKSLSLEPKWVIDKSFIDGTDDNVLCEFVYVHVEFVEEIPRFIDWKSWLIPKGERIKINLGSFRNLYSLCPL